MNTTHEMPPDAERTQAALRLRAAVEHLVTLALDDLTHMAPAERMAALGSALNRRDVTLTVTCDFPMTTAVVLARDIRGTESVLVAKIEVPRDAAPVAIN
ncbi:MAG: hypothetical protein IT483_15695 [Gammaproteobacteria bacterium]|nr:hypothetical protein [Gammaproteobacteria bacterium]